MVLGEALLGVGAASATAAQSLFGYNRSNFMYDRKMRQDQEFEVMGFRNKQAALWREDIRDLIDLTHSKMASYLVVNALELGFCVSMYCEGRLGAGTPPWLLSLYMINLAGAFMYLLASVFLAMHAQVVSKSSGVRLLTQLCRLPVPTWSQLEAARTYGQAFEGLGLQRMLRMPFLEPLARREAQEAEKAKGADSARNKSATDPWDLERNGLDIHELQQVPITEARHIQMVKRAALHWQCYDAFSRVCMTIGTIQLLFALTYYCLGYCLIQDGSPWSAWCAVFILTAISQTLLTLDVCLTRREHFVGRILLYGGPFFASIATMEWGTYTWYGHTFSLLLQPVIFFFHALWLIFALRLVGATRQPGGAWLPTRFKAVLYLDVFGWWLREPEKPSRCFSRGPPQADSHETDTSGNYTMLPQAADDGLYDNVYRLDEPDRPHLERGLSQRPDIRSLSPRVDASAPNVQEETSQVGSLQTPLPPPPIPLKEKEARLRSMLQQLQSEAAATAMVEDEKAHVQQLCRKFRWVEGLCPDTPSSQAGVAGEMEAPEPAGEPDTVTSNRNRLQSGWLKLHGYNDVGGKMQYFFHPESGETFHGDQWPKHRALPLSMSFAEERIDSFRDCVAREVCESMNSGRIGSLQLPPMPSSGRTQKQRATQEAMTMPMPFEQNPTPLRPQDVDSSQDHLLLEAKQKLFKEASSSHGGHTGKLLEAIGPPGASPDLQAEAFDPTTYFPYGGKSAVDNKALPVPEAEWDDSKDWTGHHIKDPGRVPWEIFKAATTALCCLWGFMFLVTLLQLLGFPTLHTKPLPAMVGSLFTSEEVAKPGEGQVPGQPTAARPTLYPGQILNPLGTDPNAHVDGPMMPDGEAIKAQWPRANFDPQALTCDPTGREFVVADDLGVYAAHLKQTINETSGEAMFSAKFDAIPPCGALEGQAPKDVGVICLGKKNHPDCHALVLHEHGKRLAQCPLKAPASKDLTTWTISDQWLGTDPNGVKERITSVAVDNACSSGGIFSPNEEGCVVIGTTDGRVVQLRRHFEKEKELVPSWTMIKSRSKTEKQLVQQLTNELQSGSIHVFRGNYLVSLEPLRNSVQAINAKDGSKIGEWKLPNQIAWSGLCGGGDHLYVLGASAYGEELWRFPVPVEVTSRKASHDEDPELVGKTTEM